MASKAKEVAVKEKDKEKDEELPIGAAETTDTLLPLLDLSDAAVKRLIRIVMRPPDSRRGLLRMPRRSRSSANRRTEPSSR